MAKEIERKFICNLDFNSPEIEILSVKTITQGYLSKGAASTVRVRIANEDAFITVKGKRVEITCDEYEYAIPIDDARAMLALSVTPLIEKTRYVVRDQHGQVWDVDQFHGINQGLIVAEIELASEEDTVTLPTWATKEVSHDRRFRNTYLASHRIAC